MNWNTVDTMPPLERGTRGTMECRNLLVWIDTPHMRGIALGACTVVPGHTTATFRAYGFTGDWRITHWMRVEPPAATKDERRGLPDEQVLIIGKRALDKCFGTEAQHLYIAREIERAHGVGA